MRTVLLIILTASLTACHSQLKPPAHRLAGTWSSTYNGAVVEIVAEDDTSGIYLVQPPQMGAPSFSGHFSASQTELTITNEEGGPCPGDEGNYQYAIMDGVLQMTLKHDACKARSEGTTYAWVRVFTTYSGADSDER
jgi:hypothetical protein